jgi:2-phosphosulfolactate phosphatase
VRAEGVDGARSARGVVVVIDVLRAFTVTAFALAGGAREVIYVADIEEALRLRASIPNSILSAEVDGLPVAGVPISNSPTMISAADLRGRTLVQRSSAGVQALAAVPATADALYAASLVVARATVGDVLLQEPELVTLVPSRPDHLEDVACARYLEALLGSTTANLEDLLDGFRSSERYLSLARGEVPGFLPGDLDLALVADTFDFSLPVSRGADGLLRVARQRPDAESADEPWRPATRPR